MARKSKIDIPASYIRNGIVVFILLIVGFWMFRNASEFFRTAPLFRIKDVTSAADVQFLQAKVLREIKGKNIFAVDLKQLHKNLRALYPQIYDLKVERRFPDTIDISAKRREAFAQILVKQNYLTIDDQGIVIFADKKPVPQMTLIKNAKLDKLKIFLGSKLQTPEVTTAIEIIQSFKSNTSLNKYPISDVDVGALSKTNFYIGSELQVILDQDDIDQKLDMLVRLIAQKKLDFREVKYIDLRFKEPVVGKK